MAVSSIELQNKLREFNLKGYADDAAKFESNGKDGQIIKHQSDLWTYEDEFYGGEPYSGNETIWFDNSVVFRCVYWCKVAEGVNFGDIYGFLRAALREGPSGNCIHRGPESFTQDSLIYTNLCTGNIEEFSLIEKILKDGAEVYIAYFIGGLVNVRK